MSEKRTEQEILLDIQMKVAPKARVFDIALIAMFMLITFGLAAAMFILPDNEFSEQENRMLKQFPAISNESGRLGRLLDGSFTRDIAEYYADQLPLRDIFTGFKGIAEIGMLKRENNGVILARNGFLVARDAPPDYAQLEANINYLGIFAEAVDVPVTLAMAPRTVDVLSKRPGYLPAAYPTEPVRALWRFYQSRVDLAEYVINVNLFDKLDEQIRYSDIYFRTDHHWNTMGAYYAYRKIAQSLGIEPREIGSFEIETASDRFFGTTWSSAGMHWVRPDTLEFFRFEGDEDFVTTIIDTGVSFNGFYDRSFLEVRDKYSAFIGGVNTRTEVTRPGENRPRLLLIKDSFAHAVVPFFAYHYDLIILDLRGFSVTDSVARIIGEENIGQVLFLYNIANFMESPDLAKLMIGLDFGDEPARATEREFEEGVTSREIIEKILEEFGEENMPAVEFLFSGADPDSYNFIPERGLGILMTGAFALPPEFEYIYDYALLISEGYHAFEISILRASQHHLDNFEAVRELLVQRRRVIDGMNIEFYLAEEAWIVAASRIITIDNYAILLMTTDNDKAENIIRVTLGGE